MKEIVFETNPPGTVPPGETFVFKQGQTVVYDEIEILDGAEIVLNQYTQVIIK